MAAPMKFQTRVVGWRNKREFDDVYDCLYDSDAERQRDGLERINAWKCRFTDKMPIAIECTATLLEAVLMEKNENDPNTLQLIYSMAVIRFVNLITGFLQNKGQSQPVVALAKEISLPEWLVELRHEASHKHMPPLPALRKAARTGLAWLKENFWEKQCGTAALMAPEAEEELVYPPNINGVEGEINRLSIAYQQAQFQSIQSGRTGRNGISETVTEVLSSLEQCLSDPEAGDLLTSLLLQDGYLVPTSEQLQALRVKEGVSCTRGIVCIHRALCQFWKPLIALLHSLDLTPLLLHSIIGELGKFKTAENQAATYLEGWAMQIIMAGTADRKMYKTYLWLLKDDLQLPWKALYEECVQHPNSFTLNLLQFILPNLKHQLPEQAQTNLTQLMSNYRHLLESQQPVSEASGDKSEADRIYTVEDIPMPQGKHFSLEKVSDEQLDIKNENQMEVIEGSVPMSFVLREKDNFEPWSKSTAEVDWSKFPIGSLPGQPDDPNFLVLDVSRSHSRKRESKFEPSQVLNHDKLLPPFVKTQANSADARKTAVDKTERHSWTKGQLKSIQCKLDPFSPAET